MNQYKSTKLIKICLNDFYLMSRIIYLNKYFNIPSSIAVMRKFQENKMILVSWSIAANIIISKKTIIINEVDKSL